MAHSMYLWINVWVAGRSKSVILVNTCHSERLRDEQIIIKRRYKIFTLL